MNPAAFRTVGGPGFAQLELPHLGHQLSYAVPPLTTALPGPRDRIRNGQQWLLVTSKMTVFKLRIADLARTAEQHLAVQVAHRLVSFQDE